MQISSYLKIFLGLLLFCFSQYILAQNLIVKGVVTDSVGAPLEMANIVVVDVQANSIATFGITDANGRFSLELMQQRTYLLRVSYVGHKMLEEKLYAQAGEKEKNLSLKMMPQNALDEVELIYEMPVTVKGDTIVYKADAFTTGNERKLGDVLDKLPGFQVDKDGNVKVQGKDVSKVLVDGKEFFDGDTKLATKNLPANAVDKVELLQNFNDIAPLGGVNTSDALALNIQLKEGKKSMIFGDVSAATGHDQRYHSRANLFYYAPKTSLNFIGDLNNIGQQPMSMNDYFRFNGGFGNLNNSSGSSINIGPDDSGLIPLQDNRALNVNSRFAALNLNHKPNKRWNYSGFGIANSTDTDLSSQTSRLYLRDSGNINEELTDNTNQQNRSGMLKLNTQYKNGYNLDVRYQGFLKASDIKQRNAQLSDFGGQINQIGSVLNQNPLSINQSLKAYWASNAKNIFTWENEHLYKEKDPRFRLQTTLAPFQNILPENDSDTTRLLQNQKTITQKVDTKLSWYRILTKTAHVYFNLGQTWSHQRLGSQLFNFEGEVENPLNPDLFRNNLTYRFSDTYLTLGYNQKFGNLEIRPALNLHFFNAIADFSSGRSDIDETWLLPSFYSRYRFSKTHSLSFNYAMQSQFSDAENVAPGIKLSGYNTLFAGNEKLQNLWFHSFSLQYMNFNSFNFSNFNANLSYQRSFDAITNSVVFTELEQVLTPINATGINDNWRFSAFYEKRFRKFKTGLESEVNYFTTNNTIDGNDNENQNFTQRYQVSVETNFKKGPMPS